MLYNAAFRCVVIHHARNHPPQQKKYRNCQQDRQNGESILKEPEHTAQHFSCKRSHRQRQNKGRRYGGHCVKQSLVDQHGFELPVRHSYSLKHSKFTAAGKNTGHHGVEEIYKSPTSPMIAQRIPPIRRNICRN